ncbi:MAG: glycosyltransferase family 39 protein, partial [Microgenomates group bacterium]
MNSLIDWLFTKTPFYFMTQSFWRDEAFSYLMAKMPLVEMAKTTARDFNPPFYYALLHGWINIFGASEVAIRSMSLVFFAVSIFVFLMLLIDVLKIPERKAWIYVLLYGLNPFMLYYGIEGRMYSLFALLSLSSYYLLMTRRWKWYAVCVFLGMYTHYFFMFVLGTQVLYVVLYERSTLFRLLKTLTLPVVAFLPWLYYILPTMTTKTNDFWTEPLSFSESINTLGILFTGYEMVWQFYNKHILYVSVAIVAILVYFFMRKVRKDNVLSLLLMWAFGAYFSIAIISFVKPIFVPRYLIFAVPGFLALLAYIMEHVSPRAKVVIAAVLLVMTLHYSYKSSIYKHKGDARKTMHEIHTISDSNDVIYVTDPALYFTAAYYA